MKKVLFLLLLLIGSVTISVAQSFQEVVYLKNGSVIRGLVIEQVPGVSLKIQTSDGSIFAYQMTEIEKITKESSNKNGKNKKGYKGFIDFGYTFGVGDWGIDRLELSTSHGYQFNPYLYVGGGVAVNLFEGDIVGLPIFAHVRANVSNKHISPYIDLRIGYSPLEDVKGVYMAPSIGCKIKSFNVSMGYVMQKAEYSYFDSNSGYGFQSDENCGGLSLKIGFEF